MWLTRVFLRRPTLVFVFVALTLIAAVMALQSLVVQEQPNSGLPGITIRRSPAPKSIAASRMFFAGLAETSTILISPRASK